MQTKLIVIFSAVIVISGCQVLPDRYTVPADTSNLIKVEFFGYSTGVEYIGEKVLNKPNQYHMLTVPDTGVIYLKPDTDYAISASGYVGYNMKCGWTYVIHTPKAFDSIRLKAVYEKQKCFVEVFSKRPNNNDPEGFSLRKPLKIEKFKT